MRQLLILIFAVAVTLLFSCKEEIKNTEQHPKDYVGKWSVTKKVYSNGIEDEYSDNEDVYYFNEGGKLRREYSDHQSESREQQGEWKIENNKSKDGKTDTLYLIKRTPLFNGTFEERFRVISKADKDMVLEESSWGFENADSRDKYHFAKSE
jgi:hypothetical protein